MLHPSYDDHDKINSVAYGKDWSIQWNSLFGTRDDTADAVSLIADEADGGCCLEYGIGTGRVAVPLSRHVSHIHGIDVSRYMLEELEKTKPTNVTYEVASMVGYEGSTKYDLAYCISGTILACGSYEEQKRVFSSAFTNLKKGGLFIVEVFSPVGFKVESERVRAVTIEDNSVALSAVTADLVTQRMKQAFIFLRNNELPQVRTTSSRFLYPDELIRLGEETSFSLLQRYGTWTKAGFTNDSTNMIAIFQSR